LPCDALPTRKVSRKKPVYEIPIYKSPTLNKPVHNRPVHEGPSVSPPNEAQDWSDSEGYLGPAGKTISFVQAKPTGSSGADGYGHEHPESYDHDAYPDEQTPKDQESGDEQDTYGKGGDEHIEP
jgi:hypothetical protein